MAKRDQTGATGTAKWSKKLEIRHAGNEADEKGDASARASKSTPGGRGTRGSLPPGLSQPVDPGGVGGFQERFLKVGSRNHLGEITTLGI